MTRVIEGLAQLADRYDVLLCDVWGVIHNGRESFPDACAALARWQRDVGPVVLISNSPRPSPDVIPQLDGLAVPRESWSSLVTSGDATRALLAERAPGPAWALGPDRDAPLYEGLGLQFAAPDAAAFISCTGPYDDEVETPEDYRDRFEACVARDLEMICANPDIVVQRGSRLIYCGGALAEFYASLGGRTIMAGKPWRPIYDLALDEAQRLLGRTLDKARVLAVGDGIATDVRGANKVGLDVLFVADGIHQAELSGAEGLDPLAVQARLTADAAQAAYATANLTW
jgi:HAD superfamily hydrolase (TIGR01459 family)